MRTGNGEDQKELFQQLDSAIHTIAEGAQWAFSFSLPCRSLSLSLSHTHTLSLFLSHTLLSFSLGFLSSSDPVLLARLLVARMFELLLLLLMLLAANPASVIHSMATVVPLGASSLSQVFCFSLLLSPR